MTIEEQIKKQTDDSLQLAFEFNKVDAAATCQKKVDYYQELFEDVHDELDRRQKIYDALTTEDIFIDNDLFSKNDQQDILGFVDEIRLEIDTDNILFEHKPIDTTHSFQVELEPTFDLADVLFKENNNNKHRMAKRIREKYLKMRCNRDKVRRLA